VSCLGRVELCHHFDIVAFASLHDR
jgi:hypothetical protein